MTHIHIMASRVYNQTIRDDKILIERLNSNQRVTDHNIILLDEVQDMNQDTN